MASSAFSEAEIIGAVKLHLRALGMEDWCRNIAVWSIFEVTQDVSNPDKYLVKSDYGDRFSWTVVAPQLKVLPTSERGSNADRYGC